MNEATIKMAIGIFVYISAAIGMAACYCASEKNPKFIEAVIAGAIWPFLLAAKGFMIFFAAIGFITEKAD